MNQIIYSKIASIDRRGMVIKHKEGEIYIDFKECTRNYAHKNNFIKSKCVAKRDITKHEIIFFTEPYTVVKFKNKFIIGKSATREFIELQKAIINYGYSSFDLS